MSKHPPLKELNEYACGSLDETKQMELAEHIDACPQCAEEVAESRMLDSAVRAGLKSRDRRAVTADCLPPSMLADYFDGCLASEQLIAAEQHLTECPSCRENLIAMQAILVDRHKGAFAELDEETSARALDFVAAELGAKTNAEPASLICMACRQPIPADSRFCSLCGAAIAPPRKNLAFFFARRKGYSELVRAHVWLGLSLGAIAMSFVLDRFFVQFIAVALIFGVKWTLDQAQFRIYRDILKSLRSTAESEKESTSRRRKAL